MKSTLIGILYVSVWIIIWGTVGSLIDFPLLKRELYSAGSIGQILTFSITGFFSIVSGIFLFPKLIKNN